MDFDQLPNVPEVALHEPELQVPAPEEPFALPELEYPDPGPAIPGCGPHLAMSGLFTGCTGDDFQFGWPMPALSTSSVFDTSASTAQHFDEQNRHIHDSPNRVPSPGEAFAEHILHPHAAPPPTPRLPEVPHVQLTEPQLHIPPAPFREPRDDG